MARIDPTRLSIALLHFPVYNRARKEVATSTVSLDLHDLSRLARTYGLHAFYTITPLTSQQALAHRVRDYWDSGLGREFNPTRIDALCSVTTSAPALLATIIASAATMSPIRPRCLRITLLLSITTARYGRDELLPC